MDQIERPWSPEEDQMLLNLAEKHGLENWSLISMSLPGRSGMSCSSRWFAFQRPFTPDEDEMLHNPLEKHGPNWSLISESIPGRSAKSCELRWSSVLQFVHRPFTPEEDETILRLHALHGNKWAIIARLLGGRMDDVIKKRWNSTLKGKIQGAQNRNLSLEVRGGRRAPAIDDMGRDNMSSGSTHSYSRDQSAPSWNALNERDSSVFSDEDWKWMMMTESDESAPTMMTGSDESAPSRNAFYQRDSSVVTYDD